MGLMNKLFGGMDRGNQAVLLHDSAVGIWTSAEMDRLLLGASYDPSAVPPELARVLAQIELTWREVEDAARHEVETLLSEEQRVDLLARFIFATRTRALFRKRVMETERRGWS